MREKIRRELVSILSELGVEDPNVEVLLTKNKEHGDLYSPVAMKYAKVLGMPAVQLGEEIQQRLLSSNLNDVIEKVEVRPPGFVNIFLSPNVIRNYLVEVLETGEIPVKGFLPESERKNVLLEFVSANPTGPLSIAHARQAAVGDALARIMRFAGHNVHTEYYLNDVGVQIKLLGQSLKERCKEVLGLGCAIPEGGYKGEYLKALAGKFLSVWRDKIGDIDSVDIEEFSRFAVGEILSMIRQELARFGVKFDSWYSQEVMEKSGKVEQAISLLQEKNLIYKKDGAVWFASSRFGDDKDRVMIKSDGSKTYFTADIGYHRDKFLRGYDYLINIWGPDHHGYIPRVKASVAAMGFDPNALQVVIVQLVSLYRDSEPIPMSTRQGKYITIDELMDEVGVDAARFFLLMRKTSSHLDFDLDLAKRQAPENPVYYVQYAHARACRILEMAQTGGLLVSSKRFAELFGLSKSEEEEDLISALLRFRDVIEACLFDTDPYPLVDYLRTLSTTFHRFYEKCRVLGEENNVSLFRLGLVKTTQITLRSGLSLLGVSAPDRM